jgi:hypothetical protein
MIELRNHVDILDRMVIAVEKVKARLQRAAALLENAGIPYAVVGGNAVAYWVARVDEAAVRNTQDVDILIRREDLERAKVAFEAEGFIFRHVKGIDMFLDGEGSKARDAVHLLFANEKVRESDLIQTPDVSEGENASGFQVLALESLVKMKLTSYRRKDQVHLLDMLEVGLVDPSWVGRLPDALGQRFQELLDNPEG